MKNLGRYELYQILTDDDVVNSIQRNLDNILVLIPEIRFMIGFDHKHPHHYLDVWEHTLYALSLSDNHFEIRLCLLLHDIGKPFSYIEGEVRNFHGHADVSANMSRSILTRLGFDDEFMKEVCYFIQYHDTPITRKDIERNRDLAYKRYLRQYCDALAHHPSKLDRRKKYLSRVKTYF